MEVQIVTLTQLSYEDLSRMYSDIKKNIKQVDALLENVKGKKASEVTPSEWNIFKKRLFLTRLKEQVTEIILDHTLTVKLPEGL